MRSNGRSDGCGWVCARGRLGRGSHHVIVHSGAAQRNGLEGFQSARRRHYCVGAGNRRDYVLSHSLRQLVRHPLHATGAQRYSFLSTTLVSFLSY